MKKIIIALSLVLLCMQHILFPMDAPQLAKQTNPTLSEEQIITDIDNKINEKYSSHKGGFMGLFFVNMTTQEALDLIKLAEAPFPEDRINHVFNKLYNRNDFFPIALAQVVAFGSKNLALINASNIKIIENPKLQQPISELNQLSSSKPDIMNRALREMDNPYDIVLASQHLDDIRSFAICELTDQAVTCSFNDIRSHLADHQWNSLFILWDLQKGKAVHRFDEPNPIHLLAFNPNGSCIAAALYNENTIKTWCPKTGQVRHTLSTDWAVYSIAYSQPTGLLLTAYRADDFHAAFKQWIVDPINTQGGELINTDDYKHPCRPFIGDKYKAYHPSGYLIVPKNQLSVTKKDCSLFSLCMQAIENSKKLEKNQIESSASFIKLTDLEKTIVYKEINRKLSNK